MAEDEEQKRNKVRSLIDYETKASGVTTSHMRSKSKLAHVHVRGSLVARVDYGAEIMCVRLAVGQMTRPEFECWLALKEGILFDPLPKRSLGVVHGTWFSVKPPAKTATVEMTARHYHRTERTVERYDREARRLVTILRERAGLIGQDVRIPIWPAICTDENLLRFLFRLFEE